jgi:hypothetical protein
MTVGGVFMVNTLPVGYNKHQTPNDTEYMSAPEFDSEYSIDHATLFEAEQKRLEAVALDRENVLHIIEDGACVANARDAHLEYIAFQSGE